MEAFGVHLAAAFQADLEAIYSKYTQSQDDDTDEVYLSEFCADEERTTDSDSDEIEDEVITGNDEDDDGWKSGASGPTEGSPDGYSSVSEEEEPDSNPTRNDTYILAERNGYIDDLKVQHFHSETFLLENEELTEELGNEASNNDNKLVQNSFEDANTYQNSNERICDATFVIGSPSVHKPLRDKELSSVYKRPVSVVQPFVSSNAKSADVVSSLKKISSSNEDYLTSKATSRSAAHNTDLVKAVLCSRNRIALALAEITRVKSRKSSVHLVPRLTNKTDERPLSTGRTSRESDLTSQADRESCLTTKSGGKSHSTRKISNRESDLTSSNITENTTEERYSLHGNEPIEATVNRSPDFQRITKYKEGKDVDLEMCTTVSPSEDRPRPFIRRLSMKISPPSCSDMTRSRAKALKLESDNIDNGEMNSSPTKTRSISLCKVFGPLMSDEQGSNLDGCPTDSLITSPSTRLVGILSHNLNALSPQSLVSPEQPSRSSKTVRRRSSQLLIASGDAISRDSESTVEKKQECLKQRSSPNRKYQVWRGAFLKEGSNFPLNCSPTAKRSSRDSAQDTASPQDSSKRSLICRPETAATHTVMRDNLIPKRNSGPFPALPSTQQNSNIFLESYEAVMKKLEDCKGQVETKPDAAFRSKQEHKLLCSKDGDLFSSRSQVTPTKGKPLPKKCDSTPSEMRNRRVRRVLCTTGMGDRIEKSGEKSVPSLKNSTDDRDKGDKRNGLNKVVDSGKHHKRKISSAFDEFISNNDSLLGIRAFPSTYRRDLVTKEKDQKTATSWTSSPRGRVKNSIALSGDLLCNSSLTVRSPARKRTARESVAMDTPDLLPRKQPKRGSSLSSCVEQGPSSHFSSQSQHLQEKESTPIKGRNLKRLRIEGFSPKDVKPLSPIRRAVAKCCDSKQGGLLSPCKGLGSCDKSFCFECC